jgi:hypothetical protein
MFVHIITCIITHVNIKNPYYPLMLYVLTYWSAFSSIISSAICSGVALYDTELAWDQNVSGRNRYR